jgi:hypothetical protein
MQKIVNTKCRVCGKEYFYARRKGLRKYKCRACVMKTHRELYKQKAIAYKGGKCVVCGYNKCFRALEFHHLDPTKKDFGISERGITWSWDRIVCELDKCILLCSNCHAELHSGLITLPSRVA